MKRTTCERLEPVNPLSIADQVPSVGTLEQSESVAGTDTPPLAAQTTQTCRLAQYTAVDWGSASSVWSVGKSAA